MIELEIESKTGAPKGLHSTDRDASLGHRGEVILYEAGHYVPAGSEATHYGCYILFFVTEQKRNKFMIALITVRGKRVQWVLIHRDCGRRPARLYLEIPTRKPVVMVPVIKNVVSFNSKTIYTGAGGRNRTDMPPRGGGF